jgi:hypothetical protein
MATIRIVAIDKDGVTFDIDDLYFFEEEGIHWFDQQACTDYEFRIYVDDKLVFESERKETE